MIQERFKLMPTVGIILRKENKILLIKRKNTGWNDGRHAYVGGDVDGGETVTQAAVREAQEELGIKLDKNNLKLIHVLHRKDKIYFESIDFVFEATEWQGQPTNMEPDKCDGFEWFEIDNLPESIVKCLKHVLDEVKKNKFYSEYGWD